MSAPLSARSPVSDKPRISVVLPTYNEAGNIAGLLTELHKELPLPHELIVVDDNSPDGTAGIVRDLLKQNPALPVVLEVRMKDRGLTNSIRRGIELSKGEIVCWLDCDFSMPPADLARLVAAVEGGKDIAVGSRFVKGGSPKPLDSTDKESPLVNILSRCLNWLTRMTLCRRFYDYTSGFVAVRRSVLDAVPLRGNYGEYFMDFIARAIWKGYAFVELPYVCEARRAGETKTGASLKAIARFGVRYIKTLVRLWIIRLRGA